MMTLNMLAFGLVLCAVIYALSAIILRKQQRQRTGRG
jgi:hypothetical protein